jgi:hypothetical protein
MWSSNLHHVPGRSDASVVLKVRVAILDSHGPSLKVGNRVSGETTHAGALRIE